MSVGRMGCARVGLMSVVRGAWGRCDWGGTRQGWKGGAWSRLVDTRQPARTAPRAAATAPPSAGASAQPHSKHRTACARE